ncbi:MAG TPA: hypothetical protein VMI75_21615 [Polyangiaceae bacterium]|nr:hypothetical protein [Polyangiaceae bacterium]
MHPLREPWWDFLIGGAVVGAWLSSLASNIWDQGVVSPNLGQSAQLPGSAPQTLTIAPQAPDPSATNATNGTPGSLVVNLSAPVNGGSDAVFAVERAGTMIAQIEIVNGSHGRLRFDGTTTGQAAGNTITGLGPQMTLNSASSGYTFSIDGVGGNLVQLDSTNGLRIVSPLPGLAIGGSVGYGGGSGLIAVQNAGTAPTTNPSGGGLLYASGGHLFALAATGTAVMLA